MRVNVAHEPLANGTPTTPKLIKRILKAHKVRVNEAGKIKELSYLKSKAHQKYYNCISLLKICAYIIVILIL